MSTIDKLVIFSCADDLVDVTSHSIDFSEAEFSDPPIINASTNDDVNIFISDITNTTAVLNFSAKFTGRVTYIVRPGIT
jgi:hypothetical protein